MSVWLTHMLLKNKRVYSQLPLRMCLCYRPLPPVTAPNRSWRPWSAFHQIHQALRSALLSSWRTLSMAITHLWPDQQPWALGMCSTQLLIIYSRTTGCQEPPSCHLLARPLACHPGTPPAGRRKGKEGTLRSQKAVTGSCTHFPTHPRGWPFSHLSTYHWLECGLYSEWLCRFLKIRNSLTKKEGTQIEEQLSNFNRASKILQSIESMCLINLGIDPRGVQGHECNATCNRKCPIHLLCKTWKT